MIDILAWHPGRRALLIIELKTDIVDVNDLVGRGGSSPAARPDDRRRAWLGSGDGLGLGHRRARAGPTGDGSRHIERCFEQHFPSDGRGSEPWLRDPGTRRRRPVVLARRPLRGNVGPDLAPARRVESAPRRPESGYIRGQFPARWEFGRKIVPGQTGPSALGWEFGPDERPGAARVAGSGHAASVVEPGRARRLGYRQCQPPSTIRSTPLTAVFSSRNTTALTISSMRQRRWIGVSEVYFAIAAGFSDQ